MQDPLNRGIKMPSLKIVILRDWFFRALIFYILATITVNILIINEPYRLPYEEKGLSPDLYRVEGITFALGIIYLTWRIMRYKCIMSNAAFVPGRILLTSGLGYGKWYGEFVFLASYNYNGKEYRHLSLLPLSFSLSRSIMFGNKLKIGNNVTMIVNKNNPKQSMVLDLYR